MDFLEGNGSVLSLLKAFNHASARRTSLLPLVALLYLGPGPARAALDPTKAITQYVRQTWQSGSGLPHNTVMAIAQTTDGYVWLGTEEGLARFDGDRFTVFD